MSDDSAAAQYTLMARALRHIEENRLDQPTLGDVAASVGLSAPHFQRAFSQWVGISPKRYQQYLTLDHARHLLKERFTVLDTTFETGLSGPGRLHDLFVRWEAMTPGEYARGGAGITISYGWFDSPFGEVLALGTDRGLCGMAFAAESTRADTFTDMSSRWPAATFVEAPQNIAKWAQAAFGEGGEARLHLIGAPFQIKVWEALLSIPSGHVTTYSQIAEVIGNPKAVRAVGTAVGRNPVSWLIPCHRAMRKSGGLGGYHWGLPVKRAMLAWEAARLDARDENVA
ncbi:AraC family transcriptional regulator, regulatory protein of adaptative response / methylated-DNA-[protein]-cysteine methyltransferase [Monaibacterium marinum]|uniref:methylated-DNA--[protein]-cysteine S-methyltransferase n=1 Tax=Pontivivens marinum TaxID=1690039 RepID=A0A2C9CPR5_9RHOB|nr:bifunctional helix-turn-helix domain-containing protein/methylated-DNA--[protein]-cysteine S-methyltransferase [Monaibacterium marinum]SOH93242.1 AraC family transcriptional regulator, regulatory protein of adaptative response / methylated-DNA-[protein]-cysteine methyltransferase [Monaibacterium marinum]